MFKIQMKQVKINGLANSKKVSSYSFSMTQNNSQYWLYNTKKTTSLHLDITYCTNQLCLLILKTDF